MGIEYLAITARSTAPLVLAAVVVLPIALVLAETAPRGGGRTWAELLGALRGRSRPAWGATHRFGWPVRRTVDRLYGLLLTETGEAVLVRHDRQDRRPYHSLPGGTIQAGDEAPADVLAVALGSTAARDVRGWELVDVQQRAGHQELLFVGHLASSHIEAARAASRHPLRLVPLTAEAIAHLDLHPHAVGEAVRRLAAERQRPPD